MDTVAIEELVWHHSQVPLAKLFQWEGDLVCKKMGKHWNAQLCHCECSEGNV